MKIIKSLLSLLLTIYGLTAYCQEFIVKSPDNNIVVKVSNAEKLVYSVIFKGRTIITPSQLGFEFKEEPALMTNFSIIDHSDRNINETWIPVVKSKHAVNFS